jgi:hypothetical protein
MERLPDHVLVADAQVDLNSLVQKVGDPGAGAIATFLGVTRDNFNGKPVVRLEYEGYVPMAEKVMHAICAEVRACVHLCVIIRLQPYHPPSPSSHPSRSETGGLSFPSLWSTGSALAQ